MSSAFTPSLPTQSLSSPSARVRSVLEKAEKQVGFIPDVYARMANSPGLLDTYLYGSDMFGKRSGFTPAEREVVFLTISREQGSHYGVALHSFRADKLSGVPAAVTDALRNDTLIPDPKLRALSACTRVLVATHGSADRETVATFLAAGYTERQILEIVLAIGLKTFSDWATHLFDTPVDEAFASRGWSPSAEAAGAA
jgi:alkylhydroperoxidase family enzyme